MNFSSSVHINRDSKCGTCLIGADYTPDGNFLIVVRVGRRGGVMILNETKQVLIQPYLPNPYFLSYLQYTSSAKSVQAVQIIN